MRVTASVFVGPEMRYRDVGYMARYVRVSPERAQQGSGMKCTVAKREYVDAGPEMRYRPWATGKRARVSARRGRRGRNSCRKEVPRGRRLSA